MQSVIKKLRLIDNISFISLLILTFYLSFKIISKVISQEESKLVLTLFGFLLIYTILTLITLVLTNQAFIKKRKRLKFYQNSYTFLLIIFLIYLDYFIFKDLRFTMDYLYLTENLIIFIIEILFNVITISVVVSTMYLDFVKIDNQKTPN